MGRWGLGGVQVEEKHSHNIAVGSSDHPGLTDEGTTAEVEAVAVLGSGVRSGGGPRLHPGMKHLKPCPTPRVHVKWDNCCGKLTCEL